ncbi:MAG TPA: T9SS type A sorting domain-containing protein [Chitinophagales bacterium]|nr:T9SS type A sorting domain-containing protein [Chitinophagales bacterium]
MPGNVKAAISRFSMANSYMGPWTNVSVKDVASTNFNVKVFPNPITNNLSIELSLEKEGNVLTEVFSLAGVLIKRQELTGQQGDLKYSVDFNEHANGMYLLRIKAGANWVTKKIIKHE